MVATRLDGKALADRICDGLAQRIHELRGRLGRAPGLAVVLVGDDPASATYVRQKERRAEALGMRSRIVSMPASATEDEVLTAVERLNADPTVDGFLVQLPLPRHIDERAVTLRIAPHKDADGLHPSNMGRLMAGLPAPRPCTPAGVMELLKLAKVNLQGSRALVVGRSTIVGKPTALLLLEQHATVTVCHSRTRELAAEVRRAEVVVAAVGQPGLIQGDWLAPGAVVIDVGTTRVDGKLRGDVDFDAAVGHVRAITPVPGGVGPMTVAMLMHNTVEAAASLTAAHTDR